MALPEINLQLLPETIKKISVHTEGENRYLGLSLIFALLIAALYAGIYFYHASLISSINSVDDQLRSIEQGRDKNLENRLLTVKKKLDVANSLISSHLFWSESFSRIEKLTQPKVQFKSFGGDLSTKKFNLKAEASGYPTVASQLAALLGDDTFSNIALDKVSALPTGRIEFSIRFDFDPNKLLIK